MTIGEGAGMNGVKGSSPWRRVACAIACLTVVLVVVDSLRASGPQPAAARVSPAANPLDHRSRASGRAPAAAARSDGGGVTA